MTLSRAGKLAVSALLAAMVAVGGCSKNTQAASGGPGGGAGKGRSAPVSAVKAVKEPFAVQLANLIGTVQAYSTVTIRPQVTGVLTKANLKKGQNLLKGDVLFEIDARPFEASLQQTEANLARDVVLVEQAKLDLARVGELLKKQIASQDEFDKAKSALDSLDATVRADKAASENMRLMRDYCFIRCPLDGRAGDLPVDVGNVVKANETALVVVNQIQPIEVQFSIPQGDLLAVRQRLAQGKLTVTVTVPGEMWSEEGDLTFVDNSINSAGGYPTGQVMLAATLPNAERRLWPGQFVQVSLTLAVIPDAVVVPTQAIQTGRDGKYVFVLKSPATRPSAGPGQPPAAGGDKPLYEAQYTPVTVGESRAGKTVITAGVAGGEIVVTDGQLRLIAGALAEIKGGVGVSPASSSKPAGVRAGEKPATRVGEAPASQAGGRP